MGHAIAHAAHLLPGDIGIARYDIRAFGCNFCGSLANHDDIEDDGLLCLAIGEEVSVSSPSVKLRISSIASIM